MPLPTFIEIINKHQIRVKQQHIFLGFHDNEVKTKYPSQHSLTKNFSVPASSVLVECIISLEGLIMGPHCTSFSQEMIETLMVLNCRVHVL